MERSDSGPVGHDGDMERDATASLTPGRLSLFSNSGGASSFSVIRRQRSGA